MFEDMTNASVLPEKMLPLRSVNFEMSFWCLHFDQKTNEIFVRMFALASKKRSNQKNNGTL